METFNPKNINFVYVTESILVNPNTITEQKKALKCWAVWKTEETESGSKQKVSYYTHKRHSNVSRPETWLSFREAVVLLARYREFEGLSFIKPVDLAYFERPGLHYQTDVMSQTYYKIRNLRTFLKYKCPFRGGCQ